VAATPLYERVMGDAWAQVAATIRSIHAAQDPAFAHGRFRIDRGQHVLASLLARILRLPPQGASLDTRLRITSSAEGERWLRTFDGHRLETWQFAVGDSKLAERFGILELRFRLQASGESLVYVQHAAALVMGPVRVPLPSAWAPHVQAREDPVGTIGIDVDVRVTLPVIGTLIAYRGVIDAGTLPT
jgi:hypothetical protein